MLQWSVWNFDLGRSELENQPPDKSNHTANNCSDHKLCLKHILPDTLFHHQLCKRTAGTHLELWPKKHTQAGQQLDLQSRYFCRWWVWTFPQFNTAVGPGLEGMKKNGFLYCKVDLNGKFSVKNIAFIYPNFLTGLRETFEKGVMRYATAVDVMAERCNN